MTNSLHRISSAPELQLQPSMFCVYAEGKWLKLRLHPSPTSPSPQCVQAKIIKVFRPIAISPVMVVRVDDIHLSGTFVQKVYDRQVEERLRF